MSDFEKQQLDKFIFALARGQSEALDGIYGIAAKRMTAVAYAVCGNGATAEDVVSDSFVKIAKYAKKYRGGEPMAWILRIVRNTALDAVRLRKRRGESDLADFSYTLVDENYSFDKREQALELEMALKKLPDEERRVIILRYFYDLTLKETAKKVGLTLSSAERLLKKAEQNLKKLLTGDKND